MGQWVQVSTQHPQPSTLGEDGVPKEPGHPDLAGRSTATCCIVQGLSSAVVHAGGVRREGRA